MMNNSSVSSGTMIERDLDDVPFTMIPNDLLADTDISWKAKGVISYLLGKPAHWKARTKDIENHGTGGETEVRSALQELRKAGYARLERYTEKGRVVRFVLRVANKRKYTIDGGKRVDIALDGAHPHLRVPDVENPHLEGTHEGAAVVENRDIRKKEGRKNDLRKKEKIEKSSISNKVRASGDGDADAYLTPSAVSGPRSSAEKFIQEYKTWGKAARKTATVVPAERAALQEFFTNNPEVTPRELTALMLCAWLVPADRKVEGTDFNPFWHCNHKSKRISSFLEWLPKIQEETGWNERMTSRQYQSAAERFLQQKAA
jgi:hypothetical protein